MVSKVKKAVIPVAGLGSRMLPATKSIPKELLTVYDRPVIQYVVDEAVAAGCTEIIFVTRNGKSAIENHFDRDFELEHHLFMEGKKELLKSVSEILPKHVKVASVRQSKALGLGHAVLCAKHLIGDEPFVVLLPDVLLLEAAMRKKNHSLSSMTEAWGRSGVGQIMVARVDVETVQNYGIADLGGVEPALFDSQRLIGLVEKPLPEQAMSDLAVVGRYVLPPEVLALLELTEPSVGGEIQLTDALDKLIGTLGLEAFMSDAVAYDCGSKLGFLQANLAVGFRDSEIVNDLRDIISGLIPEKVKH